jgi:hypothetical protein
VGTKLGRGGLLREPHPFLLAGRVARRAARGISRGSNHPYCWAVDDFMQVESLFAGLLG